MAELASSATTSSSASSKPRYLVTLHADVETLLGGDGRCEIEGHAHADGHPIGVSVQTALRMLCDCDVEAVVSHDGTPINISKRAGS